jgi:hypothetical protein
MRCELKGAQDQARDWQHRISYFHKTSSYLVVGAYLGGDNHIMTASVSADGGFFATSKPVVWSDGFPVSTRRLLFGVCPPNAEMNSGVRPRISTPERWVQREYRRSLPGIYPQCMDDNLRLSVRFAAWRNSTMANPFKSNTNMQTPSMIFRVIVGMGFLLLAACPVWAQAPAQASAHPAPAEFARLKQRLKRGDWVIVSKEDGGQVLGRLQNIDGSQISVLSGATLHKIAADEALSVQVERNRMLIGAMIGAAAAFPLGVLSRAYAYNEGGSEGGALTVPVALVAGTGAAWGKFHRRWQKIYERTPGAFETSTALSFPAVETELLGSLASGNNSNTFVDNAGATVDSTALGSRQQLGLSVGVGRRYPSGLAVELELNRTLNAGFTHVACIPRPKTFINGVLDPGGQCDGSADVGTESILTATERLVYTARKAARVQPIVSAGIAFVFRSERTASSFPAYLFPAFALPVFGLAGGGNGNDWQVGTSTTQHALGAVPVSGGVRVAITPSLAVRSEFTYVHYVGIDLAVVHTSLSRASVGIAYKLR